MYINNFIYICILVYTGCSFGGDGDKDLDDANGTITCSRYEEAGGENAKSVIIATFEDYKVTKAYSTMEFKNVDAFNNVCEGIKITNEHSENKKDYECSGSTVKFLNFFQLQEKKEYKIDEFYLDLRVKDLLVKLNM